MISGIPVPKIDHRDFDFHATFGTVGFSQNVPEYNADAGLTMPNQNAADASYTPPAPALPSGCTDYACVELCTDEDGVLYSPMLMENLTHASALGGADVRAALGVASRVFNKGSYFAIRASRDFDMFDAIRLAMFSTQDEKRSVSIGIPWYPAFEGTVKEPDGSYTAKALTGGILTMPWTLDITGLGWHNAKIAGWKTINGVMYLTVKSWQGRDYGDGGWCYMSREICNAVFSVSGTCAFTLAKQPSYGVQTVVLPWFQTFISLVRNMLNL